MRKFFILLLVTCALGSAMAQRVFPRIFITLHPIQNISVPQPPIVPMSLTQTFTAQLCDGELLIQDIEITDMVDVYVTDVYGSVVYSTTANMAPGSEVSISTENWEAGAYTLYINYNTTSLVGDFELE